MNDLPALIFTVYKKKSTDLPSLYRLVMFELFRFYNYQQETFLIELLEELISNHFYIEPCYRLKNVSRSIKKSKSDHVISSTVPQRIVIQIRELYEYIYRINPIIHINLSSNGRRSWPY